MNLVLGYWPSLVGYCLSCVCVLTYGTLHDVGFIVYFQARPLIGDVSKVASLIRTDLLWALLLAVSGCCKAVLGLLCCCLVVDIWLLPGGPQHCRLALAWQLGGYCVVLDCRLAAARILPLVAIDYI